MSASSRASIEPEGDSADGDAVRRSNRRRTIKRFDSPSPPPPIKRTKDSSKPSVTPSTSKAGTSSAQLLTVALSRVPTKNTGPSPTAVAPTPFRVAPKNEAPGPSGVTPAPTRVLPKRNGAGSSGASPAKAAQPKTRTSARTAAKVKPTKVWLTKTQANTVENDPLLDENIRKRITELKAENDALASSNTAHSRQILRVGDKLSKLRRKLEEGTEKDSVEGIVKRAQELLTPVSGMMFASQLRNCGREPGTRRFTEPDLLMAYSIYKQSPRCYMFMAKIFTLPGVEGLLQWVAKVEPVPGKGLDKAFFDSRNMGHLLDPVPIPGIPVTPASKKRVKKKSQPSEEAAEEGELSSANGEASAEAGETSTSATEGGEKEEESTSVADGSAEPMDAEEAAGKEDEGGAVKEEASADSVTFVI